MTIGRPPHVEQRETQRSYLHRLDSEFAWILSRSGELKARVLDITPKGIGLVLEGASARIPLLLEKGDVVPIRMERGGQEVTVKARLATRSETLLEKDTLRLGFRIESDDDVLTQASPKLENRAEEPRPHRFSLKDAPMLECESDDPSRNGQKAYYTIRDLSLKGALLETSARNKFLLPNLRLALTISVPGHGRFLEAVLVRRVQAAQDRYLLGIEFSALGEDTVRALGDFCLNFARDVSYQIMLEEGFPADVLADSLTVQTMASQQDFMQITQIRLQVEHERERSLDVSDPWLMMDERDGEASHVSVKLGKRVVASARLLEEGDTALSVSRVVVDRAFTRAVRGPRVETVLWRGIFKAALQSERGALLVLDEGDAPAFLKTLGGRRHERGYWFPLGPFQSGWRARFGSWARYVAPGVRELSDDGKLTITKLSRIKLWLAKRFHFKA